MFLIVLLALIVASQLADIDALININWAIIAVSLFFLAISIIIQFLKKNWLAVILIGSILWCTIGAFFVYMIFLFFIETIEGDKWADNLEIPDNIELNIPKRNKLDIEPETKDDLEKSKLDIELYKSFQPGIYKYDFYVGKIESGTVYLKAYEVTQGSQLSVESLLASSMKIKNPENKIMKFEAKNYFTIYEGDFGKSYAARFEIWYKPDSDNEKEIKLIEKIYRIEGWQR